MLVSSILLVLFCHRVSSDEEEIGPRIVGGSDCDIKAFPYTVAIISNMLCGGSLIKWDWVLTAAHCLEAPTLRNVKTIIRAGYTEGSKLVQVRFLKRAYIHDQYDGDLLDAALELRYDIGLVLLNRPFKKSPVAQLARLPEKGFADKCTSGMTAGIGKANYTEPSPGSLEELFSRHLKCVKLPIISRQECGKSYTEAVLDHSVICTWDKGKDSCVGDSGGPFVCKGVQIGVVSYGPKKCGQSDDSGVFTKVESYLDFIRSHLNSAKKAGKRTMLVNSKSTYNKAEDRAVSESVWIVLVLVYLV